MCVCVCVKQIFVTMSNLQGNSFRIGLRKINQRKGENWLTHAIKHHREIQTLGRKHLWGLPWLGMNTYYMGASFHQVESSIKKRGPKALLNIP